MFNVHRIKACITHLPASLLLTVLLCCYSSGNPKSDLRFDHITMDRGLSSNFVQAIIRDRRGFMWFGTQDGLNRYDGYTLIVYKHDPGDNNSLSNNFISALHEDSDGIIWIGTTGGLNSFDPRTETFTRYLYDPGDPQSISNDDVRSILEDRKGRLWFGTARGLNKFDRSTQTFTHYRHDPDDPNTLDHEYVVELYEDSRGTLWIGTGDLGAGPGGLNRFDTNNNKVTLFRHPTIDLDWITSIQEDADGNLWLGTDVCLMKFDRAMEVIKDFCSNPDSPYPAGLKDYIYTIQKGNSGYLWLGSYRYGLWKFDRSTDTFDVYQNSPFDPKSLSNNSVMASYTDEEGRLWLGTWGGGINILNPSPMFTFYRINEWLDAPAMSNDVRAIYEDSEGSVWLGTLYGLHVLDRGSADIRTILPGSEYVFFILEGPEENLLLGTRDNLSLLDTGTMEARPIISESITYEALYAGVQDRSGNFWFGTRGYGLLQLDTGSETIIRQYIHEPNNPATITHNDVRTLLVDGSDVLWVGTNNGLNIYDRETRTFVNYFRDPDNPLSLPDNEIRVLFEDNSGTIWIGTGGGLGKFDGSEDKFIHYTERDGLPNNTINGILEDSHGNLWISTNRGLSRFDSRTNVFNNYDVTDGLYGDYFNRGAFFKNERGEMFFGSQEGFTIFHPDSIRHNPNIPPVVITDFLLFNEKVPISEESPLKEAITDVDIIHLSHDQNTISFEFAALDYTAPQRNQYAYKMTGIDENWVYSGNRRYVNYTKLPPGEYVFRVKGSNNHGVWNEGGTSVAIVITPPWWRTTWAYAGYLVVFLTMFYGFRRYELNRQRLKHRIEMEHFQQEQLKELDRMKSRFFENISHEFRTPLTLIEGPLKEIKSGSFSDNLDEQYELMLGNTRRLKQLVNQLLDLSRIESGRMKLSIRRMDIIEVVKGVAASFESLAGMKRIEFNIQCTDEPVTGWFDRDAVEKILMNLLSNAFKFTPEGGEVHVTINPAQRGGRVEGIVLSVTDTGIGISPDEQDKIFDRFYQVDQSGTREYEGSGIGLALIKELIELHRGEITVTSEPDKGSTFTVILPLDKETFSPDEIDDTGEPVTTPYAYIPETEPPTSGETIEEDIIQEESGPVLLVIEDNAEMRKYIRSHLSNGFRIIEAVNGKAGIQKAVETIPDLIISDVMMPEMDGYEVCKELKTDERTSHIPIILLTAKASSESKLEGLETGADDYIMKPFDAHELRIRVKNLIEQRRKLRERFRNETTIKLKDVTVTSMDEKFLRRAMELVENHISDRKFDTETFAKEMYLSRRQLHRKMTALTDLSPSQFMRRMRLARATDLLRKKAGNISEIADLVGYESPSKFSRAFKEELGKTPSEYQAEIISSER